MDIPAPTSHDEGRFLATVLFLQANDPVTGIAALETFFGYHQPYAMGWNEVVDDTGQPLRWVFISAESGRTTRLRPDSAGHIPQVPPADIELNSSRTWAWATRFAPSHSQPRWAAYAVGQVLQTAAAFPSDITAEQMQAAVSWFNDVIPEGPEPLLEREIRTVITPYLSLELPGCVAMQLLALRLWQYAIRSTDKDPVDALIAMQQDLVDQFDGLVADRTGMPVLNYCQISFVAWLYGMAALTMSTNLAARAPERTDICKRLARSDQYVDELLTHRVMEKLARLALPHLHPLEDLDQLDDVGPATASMRDVVEVVSTSYRPGL